jgi:hypothetical protein
MFCWASMAHTCNLSYLASRDQEDLVSKPTWHNSSQDPMLNKPFTKKRLVELLSLSSNASTEKRMFHTKIN